MIDEREWLWQQTNKALKHSTAVTHATDALVTQYLPCHPDTNKNWDSYIALEHAHQRTGANEPILDAGAGDESAFLPGLHKLGHDNLIGINLDRKDDYKAGVRNGIRYAYGDITSTPFPNNIFAFVACLSVIEHGVDWRAFLLEMHRILKSSGYLFLSFDYWPDKIDTTGLRTHDADINIFSEKEVRHLLDFADTVGIGLIGRPVDFSVQDPLIFWAGRQYTFMNVLLRKF